LALGALGQAGEDGQAPCLDSRLDRCLVDAGDLADETVLGLVEVLGREDAGGDGAGAGAEALEGGGELKVLLEENPL
jgi:hypothetical protein